MPNNHLLQLLRKNGEPTSEELNTLLEGQPLYDMENNNLYIGGGGERSQIN